MGLSKGAGYDGQEVWAIQEWALFDHDRVTRLHDGLRHISSHRTMEMRSPGNLPIRYDTELPDIRASRFRVRGSL